MKINSHRLISEMPPLIAGELELSAELHEHEDGRYHIYFYREEDSDRVNHDYTRVGYRDFDEYTMLLGLKVATSLRGRGLGQNIVQYFLDQTAERGQEFDGTGIIVKPLIALTLVRAGLKPLSDDVLVEILPWRKNDTSEEPKVHVLQNDQGIELNGDRPSGGKFFTVVSPEERVSKYPMSSPEMLVALHTQYVPAERI